MHVIFKTTENTEQQRSFCIIILCITQRYNLTTKNKQELHYTYVTWLQLIQMQKMAHIAAFIIHTPRNDKSQHSFTT